MEKIKIRKKIYDFDESCLEGKIKKVKSNFSKQIKELEDLGWEDIELVKEVYYEYSEIIAYGYILESDSEYNERLKEDAIKLEKEKKKIEKQAKQYQKLKEKFEPKCCDNPDMGTFMENNSEKSTYGITRTILKCKNCGRNGLL